MAKSQTKFSLALLVVFAKVQCLKSTGQNIDQEVGTVVGRASKFCEKNKRRASIGVSYKGYRNYTCNFSLKLHAYLSLETQCNTY